MEWLLIWLVLGVVAGMIASSKQRSFLGFFVLGLLIPLIGIVAAVVAKPNVAAREDAELRQGGRVKCPHCAELIRSEAAVCRFCGRDVGPAHGSVVGGVVLREDWNQR